MRTPSENLALEPLLLTEAALVFRAINHSLRRQLLELIHQEGEPTVTSLYKQMKLDQPTCSQHLSILREAELVVTRREGHHVYYRVNYPKLHRLHTLSAML